MILVKGQEFSDIPYCPKELSEISIDKQHWLCTRVSDKHKTRFLYINFLCVKKIKDTLFPRKTKNHFWNDFFCVVQKKICLFCVILGF